MVNYYQLLNVAPTAEVEVIQEAIRRELRINSGRTNHPNLQKRQDAERKVEQLEEAENILLDAAKRGEYDQQLKSAPTESRQSSAGVDTQDQDLVLMGWQKLTEDNVADAMYLAKKATEADGGNADAWALLGQAKFRWGEVEDAIYEYKRAIDLRPNDAEFYFDLGSIFESIGKPNDALTQYQRAIKIDPGLTMYRAAVGILMVQNELPVDGLNILEQCVKEEPGNKTYKVFLAVAYHDRAIISWPFIPAEMGGDGESRIPTEKEHLEEAESYLQKAEDLGVDDEHVHTMIREGKERIALQRERGFEGNKIAFGLAIVAGIVGFISGASASGSEAGMGIGIGFYFIIVAVLYFLSCRTPGYVMNRRILAGKADGSMGFVGAIVGEGGGGCLMAYFAMCLVVLFMPFMALRNYIKNYVQN